MNRGGHYLSAPGLQQNVNQKNSKKPWVRIQHYSGKQTFWLVSDTNGIKIWWNVHGVLVYIYTYKRTASIQDICLLGAHRHRRPCLRQWMQNFSSTYDTPLRKHSKAFCLTLHILTGKLNITICTSSFQIQNSVLWLMFGAKWDCDGLP